MSPQTATKFQLMLPALSAPLRVMRIRWDGLQVGRNGIDPETIFKVDFIKPIEALERISRTV